MPGVVGFLKAYPAPSGPYDPSIAISVPDMVPVLIGALESRAHLFNYVASEAFDAIQAVREVQVSMINPLNRLDDIYRVLDTAFNGTVYVDAGGGVIEPEIPLVPRVDFDGTTQSNRKLLHDIRERLESDNPDIAEIISLLGQVVTAIG